MALGILSPALHGLGWFQIFLKETVIPISFLWSLWHFTSPNRLPHSVASMEVEKIFCWRAWLLCCCSLCANDTARGREAGHPPPSHGHHVSCFPTIIREVCFTLLFHFSLSFYFVPQIQTLDCETNCALRSVGYHRRMFCPGKVKTEAGTGTEISHPGLSYRTLLLLLAFSSSACYPSSPA